MIDVMDYYGLVVSQARKKHKYLLNAGIRIDIDDLIQDVWVAVIEAAGRFDPHKGVKFSTFVYRRIQGAMIGYLREQDPLNQQQRQKLKQLKEVQEKLRQKLGRNPFTDEMAEALNISEGEVHRIEAFDISIISTDGGGSIPDGLGFSSPPDQEEESLAEDVDDCLKTALEKEEKRVLIFRFLQELPLREVGALLDVGIETARRREIRAQGKMRDCLEGKGWEVATALGLYAN